MFKSAFCLLALVCATHSEDDAKIKYEDPLTTLDKHLTRTLAYHYLWPWNQLMRAAAALELEENLEDTSVKADPKVFSIKLRVKSFKPDDIEVRIKNRYIIVEGKHKVSDNNKQFVSNHFVQSFMMAPGTLPEEVTASYDEKGVLTIQAPRHDVPPPVDIKVPIVVKSSSENVNKSELPITEKAVEKTQEETTFKNTPIEPVDLTEATTQHGKIKKKELKATPKTSKDNEVSKDGDANALEYIMVEE